MKWLGKPKDEEEVTYWQTISDVLSALLLILLLIIMLLIMYVVLVPENENKDLNPGDHYEQHSSDAEYEYGMRSPIPSPTVTPTPTPTPIPTAVPTPGSNWNSIGGGGGNSGWGISVILEEGNQTDEGTPKAAVYVKVIDGETRRAIREEGITFVFLDKHRNQIGLNAYYPETVTFLEYKTSELGVFYLPEKIDLGEYTLSQMSEPEGYDISEDIDFAITEEHDWSEPYIIEVELYPSRNVINLKNVDAVTGKPVGGGSYDVYAVEDIITKDGTLRYTAGSIVDQISCDSTGNGSSKELYLGEYSLQQREPPQYYAKILEPVVTKVEKERETQIPVDHTMYCQRTTVNINVHDALYGTIPIPGASFRVTNMPGIENYEVSSDENGRIRMDELAKNTTYTLKQLSTADGYRHNGEEYSFTVGNDGRVDGETTTVIDVPNRTIRLGVSIRDALLRNQVTDYNVTLYSQNDEIVKIWNSTANAEVTAGLNPETYRIVINGAGTVEKEVTLGDTMTIQYVDCYVWTNGSLIAAFLVVVLIVMTIWITVALRKRRKEKKK